MHPLDGVPRYPGAVLVRLANSSDIFGVTERPSADNADRLYDQIAARLAEPAFRPRSPVGQFGISVLATTDDPCDDLAAHAALAADPDFATRVIPTFRPDRYLEPAGGRIGRSGRPTRRRPPTSTPATIAGYLAALEDRRRYFVAHGAVSADHSHRDLNTQPLDSVGGQPHLSGRPSRSGDRRRGHRLPPAHDVRDGTHVL